MAPNTIWSHPFFFRCFAEVLHVLLSHTIRVHSFENINLFEMNCYNVYLSHRCSISLSLQTKTLRSSSSLIKILCLVIIIMIITKTFFIFWRKENPQYCVYSYIYIYYSKCYAQLNLNFPQCIKHLFTQVSWTGHVSMRAPTPVLHTATIISSTAQNLQML